LFSFYGPHKTFFNLIIWFNKPIDEIGGYTGLSAAHRLAELCPEDKVILLDAQGIGEGASARNSGFVVDSTLNDGQASHSAREEYLLKYPEGEFTIAVKQLLADIYEKEGNLELALKLYKQLPQTDQNVYKIALLNFKLGNYFEAKRNFYILYEKYPKYRNDIAYYLAMIEINKGNIKQAKRYLEEAVKGMDYKKVAQSYLILGDIYEQEGKLEDALNQYVNVIYLYSQEKDLVEQARIKGAKILLKQGKRIEASCMLEPISSENDEASNLKQNLPKCIKD